MKRQGSNPPSSFARTRRRGDFGAGLAVVSVDKDTGRIRLERLIAVDDCGNAINPLLVDGRIVSALAQGIGQAMLEHVRYATTASSSRQRSWSTRCRARTTCRTWGARPHRHAIAPQSTRRQGRRRRRRVCRAAGDRQRGGRRAVTVRDSPRRHAARRGEIWRALRPGGLT